jgi:hypothetical protein
VADLELKAVARDQGYWRVYLDGVEVSAHTTERKAETKAFNVLFENPGSAVNYRHDYEVDVTIDATDIVMKAISGGVLTQPDGSPNPFPIAPVSVPGGTQATSAPFLVTGADSFAVMDISVDIGTYSLNGNLPTSLPGTMTVADTVELQHTAGGDGSQVIQTVTIGGTQSQFISTATAGQAKDLLFGINIYADTPTRHPITANRAKMMDRISSADSYSGTFNSRKYANQEMAPNDIVYSWGAHYLKPGIYYIRWTGTTTCRADNTGIGFKTWAGSLGGTFGTVVRNGPQEPTPVNEMQIRLDDSGNDRWGHPNALGAGLSQPAGSQAAFYYDNGILDNLEIFYEEDLPRINAGQVLSQEYVDRFGNVQIYRPMNCHGNNGNYVVEESHVSEMDWLTWFLGDRPSVPPEFCAKLANELNVQILHINYPSNATNAVWDRITNDLNTHLNPSIHVWPELGNESWNGLGSPQTFSGSFANSSKYLAFADAPNNFATWDGSRFNLAGHGMASGDEIILFNYGFLPNAQWGRGKIRSDITVHNSSQFSFTGSQTGRPDTIFFKKTADSRIGENATNDKLKVNMNAERVIADLRLWSRVEAILGTNRTSRVSCGQRADHWTYRLRSNYRTDTGGSTGSVYPTEAAEWVSKLEYWGIGVYPDPHKPGTGIPTWFDPGGPSSQDTIDWLDLEFSTAKTFGLKIDEHIFEISNTPGSNAKMIGYESGISSGIGEPATIENAEINEAYMHSAAGYTYHNYMFRKLATLGFAACNYFTENGNWSQAAAVRAWTLSLMMHRGDITSQAYIAAKEFIDQGGVNKL